MDQQIEQMLKKVAIEVAKEDRSRFVSSIFVVPKKDSGHCPVISLKNLNYYIPYSHFKMVGLFPLKEILQEGGYMCKIDLKDAHFSVSLNQKFPKSLVSNGRIYSTHFLCLWIALGPAPRIFTKLMRIPISLLRKPEVRLIIFLNNILPIASLKEELTLA